MVLLSAVLLSAALGLYFYCESDVGKTNPTCEHSVTQTIKLVIEEKIIPNTKLLVQKFNDLMTGSKGKVVMN